MAAKGGGAAGLDRVKSPALDRGQAVRSTIRVANGANDLRDAISSAIRLLDGDGWRRRKPKTLK